MASQCNLGYHQLEKHSVHWQKKKQKKNHTPTPVNILPWEII